MSEEQRAAMEQRLAQLRAAQAAAAGAVGGGAPAATNGGHHADPRAPAPTQPKQQQQPPPAQRPPAPQMGYGYDDDDDEEEEEVDHTLQQFEDEFLRLVAQRQQQQVPSRVLNAASVTQVSATRHADEGVSVVATDKSAHRARELGDFEALRLAKMGDGVSMRDFGAACGITWKTFADNHGRNALHYAADAGSAALIREIADDLHVPYVADERRMTPLDIAILNGHTAADTDEVYAALIAAAKASRHADGNMSAAASAARTLESVLQAHTPAPPKFVMSKPVPKASEAAGPRSFWAATASGTAASVQSSSGADLDEAGRRAVCAAVCALDEHGRLAWLRPHTRTAAAACAHWQVTSVAGPDGATAVGVAVAQVLADAALKGSAAAKLSATHVAVAAHLAVRADQHHTGIAAALLHGLRTRVESCMGAGSNGVVFFASGTQLRRPPTALATVKWYRRVFDATAVHASDSAFDVFPDFYNYDEVLRADAVLKGALPASLAQQYQAALQLWCAVETASDEQCGLIAAFIAAKAGTSESGVDLACVPTSVDELRRTYLGHPDHRAYVRTNTQGAITDMVIFRVRDARAGGDGSGSAAGGSFAVEVVYAIFTSVVGTAKADHLMLLASKLLAAKVLLVPTLFGITDSDLVKSNFDEMVSHREYVYAVSPATRRDVAGLSPMPAAKLSLPLYTI